MIAILLLSVIVSAPPQAPPVRDVPPQAPAALSTYADALARVEGGERLTIYAGVPLPAKAEPNAVRVDAIPREPAGVYECHRGADGSPKMAMRVAAPVAVAPYRDPVGWHRHKCESAACGFVWSHPDGTSSAGHYCPGCGRYENDHYKGTAPPTTAKPVPARPKRISMNGRWYDQYPDGRLVECST